MNQKKIVEGINIGEMVKANHVGCHPRLAVIGKVEENDERMCVIRQENGLTATIFGNISHDANRRWPGVIVKKI